MIRRAIISAMILFAGLLFAFFGSPLVTLCLLIGFIAGLLAGSAAAVWGLWWLYCLLFSNNFVRGSPWLNFPS